MKLTYKFWLIVKDTILGDEFFFVTESNKELGNDQLNGI